MARTTKPKVVTSLTEVLPLLESGKAQYVRCHQRGSKDMALLDYRALEPVLHKVISDYGKLVAVRHDLLEQMLAAAGLKMKSVILKLDSPRAKKAGKRTKKAAKKTRKVPGKKAAKKAARKKAVKARKKTNKAVKPSKKKVAGKKAKKARARK